MISRGNPRTLFRDGNVNIEFGQRSLDENQNLSANVNIIDNVIITANSQRRITSVNTYFDDSLSMPEDNVYSSSHLNNVKKLHLSARNSYAFSRIKSVGTEKTYLRTYVEDKNHFRDNISYNALIENFEKYVENSDTNSEAMSFLNDEYQSGLHQSVDVIGTIDDIMNFKLTEFPIRGVKGSLTSRGLDARGRSIQIDERGLGGNLKIENYLDTLESNLVGGVNITQQQEIMIESFFSNDSLKNSPFDDSKASNILNDIDVQSNNVNLDNNRDSIAFREELE